jgi:hypothetical protein
VRAVARARGWSVAETVHALAAACVDPVLERAWLEADPYRLAELALRAYGEQARSRLDYLLADPESDALFERFLRSPGEGVSSLVVRGLDRGLELGAAGASRDGLDRVARGLRERFAAPSLADAIEARR